MKESTARIGDGKRVKDYAPLTEINQRGCVKSVLSINSSRKNAFILLNAFEMEIISAILRYDSVSIYFRGRKHVSLLEGCLLFCAEK